MNKNGDTLLQIVGFRASNNRRNAAITKILETASEVKNLSTVLERFYRMFDMGQILHRVGANKEQGVSGKCVLLALLSVVFMLISLSEAISKAQDSFSIADTVSAIVCLPKV